MTDHGRTMLHLRQITKRFGSQTVLQGIDLDLRAGEFVSLLGPSGCGKTTLLRIVCGIETPELGQVLMQGQDITAWPASQRRFGVVFQSYALFPNMTAMENVRYGLSGLPRREAAERAAEMLALVGLPEQAGKFPSQLSGGQQQRVALARALAPRPRLLLLDEPLSALDAQVRQELRAEIRALQQRLGITTLMVTHDQDEALAMSDRVVLLARGQIAQQGAPRELYEQPASALVAGFIGHAGYEIARTTTRILSDQIVISGNDIERVVIDVPGVLGCHQIRTRGSNDQVFLDMHVWMRADMTLTDAHSLSHVVKDRVMTRFPQITDAVIHIEPPPS